MLSVIMGEWCFTFFVMLSFIMLSFIMLGVIMLSAIAPFKYPVIEN